MDTEGARRQHLIADALVPAYRSQLGLFDVEDGRADAIARLKREINARHGRFVLRSGAILPLAHIYRDVANAYDICDVRGKICF